MKIRNPLNLEAYDLKEAISTLRSARLMVGQTLYFTLKQVNQGRKKKRVSLTKFLQAIAYAYPNLSLRSFQRSYRVYERMVADAGFWISDLEQIDFMLLVQISECAHITPLTRRELIVQVQKRMDAGYGYAQIAPQLKKTLAALRKSPPRLPKAVLDTDHRLADVKMDLSLITPEVDKPAKPLKVPKNFPGMFSPPVVYPGKRRKSK